MIPPPALRPIGPAVGTLSLNRPALLFQRSAVPRLGVRLGLEFLREGQHPVADDFVHHAPSQSARPRAASRFALISANLSTSNTPGTIQRRSRKWGSRKNVRSYQPLDARRRFPKSIARFVGRPSGGRVRNHRSKEDAPCARISISLPTIAPPSAST